MKKKYKQIIGMMLIMLILVSSINVFALERNIIEETINDTAAYLYQTVAKPQVDAIGGEWTVIGLARSGYDIPDQYYQNYYQTVEDYVKECGGILHEKKYTEYSRVILALTAIGKDPSNVAGYNLLTPLGDYDKTIWQGMNGPIWALIALDSGNYEIPKNSEAKTQATRDMYINRILECQLSDGGWSLLGGTDTTSSDVVSEPDITGMALQALARYQDRDDVKKATEKALACMSAQQNDNGGFSAWSTENSESSVQMLVALCELGISVDDPMFVKNDHSILDNLMTFYQQGKGFSHTHFGDAPNQMATEQCFYALVAVKRALDGKSSLYRMADDSLNFSEPTGETEQAIGLPGKHTDIHIMDVQYPGKTFFDISGNKNESAIEALAARGIISGKSNDIFDPDSTMTRAEFATIIVRGLGLPTDQKENVFSDILDNDWFCPYINAAHAYGIVNGISENEFAPSGTITREEAAVIIDRTAKLCGMDTEMELFAARDVLASFTDYVKVSDWAITAVAFCYDNKILSDDALQIAIGEKNTMQKYRKQITVGAAVLAVLAVLAFTFWYGGNAPELRGWNPQSDEIKTEQQEGLLTTQEPTYTSAPSDNPSVTPAAAEKNGAEPQKTAEAKTPKETAMAEKPSNSTDNKSLTAEEKVNLAAQMSDGSTDSAEPGDEEYSANQGMEIDESTGKDKYLTGAVPEGKPVPVDPQNIVITDKEQTCTLSVRCDTILKNIAWLDAEKVQLVPKDGVIFAEQTVTFYEGESVFNLLTREMKKNKIHLEFANTPIYNSAYIEGINNLYEFDCGELSGWMYKVNGWFPNYGCSRYQLKQGDKVEWVYTCDLGNDVGGYNDLSGE